MNSKKKSEIGRIAREGLDVEATRIAQETLCPNGCDPVVCRMDDGITRFLIKVQIATK